MKFTSIKIRNKEGLFSGGGSHPRFTKRGKVWSCIGHVSSHLGQMRTVPDDWEIVIAEIHDDGFTPSSISTKNAHEHWLGVIQRKQEAKDKRTIQIQKYKMDKEREIYESLRRKFENDKQS